LKYKTASVVFRALQEWATFYGPIVEFNLHMLTRFHGDFDSTFGSQELRQEAERYHIKTSFAAPQTKNQSGISEANWRNVRNLAYGMMNQARVPMEFFSFCS
jgi:transposase InsO family protein